MSQLRRLRAMVNRDIDNRLAEPVEVHPWTKDHPYTVGGGPDTTRDILNTRAIYMTPGADPTGVVGGGDVNVKIETPPVWMNLPDEKFHAQYWRSGDRVYWVHRKEWFEISYISPTAGRRPNVYLLRLYLDEHGNATTQPQVM